MKRCVILANGEMEDYEWYTSMLMPDDIVLCADGGADHAHKLGLLPRGIAGDLDSISPVVLEKYRTMGVEIRRYPSSKDEVDSLIALEWAFEFNPAEILLLGCTGKRLDHTVANIHILLAGIPKRVKIRLMNEGQEIFLVAPSLPAIAEVKQGSKVSLIPLGGNAHGIKTENLRYTPPGGRLDLDKPIGVSNVAVASPFKVSVASGILIVFINYLDV